MTSTFPSTLLSSQGQLQSLILNSSTSYISNVGVSPQASVTASAASSQCEVSQRCLRRIQSFAPDAALQEQL